MLIDFYFNCIKNVCIVESHLMFVFILKGYNMYMHIYIYMHIYKNVYAYLQKRFTTSINIPMSFFICKYLCQ